MEDCVSSVGIAGDVECAIDREVERAIKGAAEVELTAAAARDLCSASSAAHKGPDSCCQVVLG